MVLCPEPVLVGTIACNTIKQVEQNDRFSFKLPKRGPPRVWDNREAEPEGDNEHCQSVTQPNPTPHTHKHKHRSTQKHAHTHARTHARTHAQKHTRTHAHTHKHTRTHAHTHKHKRPHAHTCWSVSYASSRACLRKLVPSLSWSPASELATSSKKQLGRSCGRVNRSQLRSRKSVAAVVA
jgi:hypothetical protein